MQRRESAPIKVGIFVFAGVFLAMAIIFMLGNEKQLFKRQYRLQTSFHNISGLRIGAQVQLAGLSVGMVDKISLADEVGDKNVKVTLAINKEFQDRIRKDSQAEISTQGLLGDKYVAISMGTPPNEILKDGDFLLSQEKPSFASIVEKTGDFIDDIDKAAQLLTSVLGEVKDGQGLIHALIYETPERPLGRDFAEMARSLKDASQDLHQIIARVKRGEGTVGAFLQDPSLYYDLRRLFSRVERNKILTHIIRSRVRDLELEKINGGKDP